MPRKEGAKKKLLRYFLANVGREIPYKELEDLCKDNGSNWGRSLRSLRPDGWIIIYDPNSQTYCFPYREPMGERQGSRAINKKLRAEVELRDQSTCQMCGRNVKDDHIVIQIDHIVPYSWGGKTELKNLQCLCRECNGGKKNWIAGEDPDLMISISKAKNTGERLRLYFEHYPNQEISVERLSVIGRTREWTRQLRTLRQKNNMDIESLPAKKDVRDEDCYIYHKNE